ncbi:hypothetical protein CW304_21365 [Bacillus sp. UFRGS-B20]|nr:hypothetical protein CW304_21365 [Bacillus sp. UFRGS-B20]
MENNPVAQLFFGSGKWPSPSRHTKKKCFSLSADLSSIPKPNRLAFRPLFSFHPLSPDVFKNRGQSSPTRRATLYPKRQRNLLIFNMAAYSPICQSFYFVSYSLIKKDSTTLL